MQRMRRARTERRLAAAGAGRRRSRAIVGEECRRGQTRGAGQTGGRRPTRTAR